MDLDQRIRDGLTEAAADIGRVRPDGLAQRLVATRARQRQARTTHVGTVAVAVMLVALVAGVSFVVTGSRHRDRAQVATGPGEAKTFADLGPGWHVLDTGPVRPMNRASVAWTGRELLVAGVGGMYSYDPNTGAWRTLAPPPSALGGLVWTGPGTRSATTESSGTAGARSLWWDPDADVWHDIGTVPVAPGLTAAGSRGPTTGPTTNDYGDSLVWTGQRVIDSTHGAVLDPNTWRWTVLAMPADLVAYAGLLSTNPVWDGHELVLSSYGTAPGLAWNALGTSYRSVPGLPTALAATSYVPPAAATAASGRVVLVTGTDAGTAASLDAETGQWTALPAVPGMAASEGCPQEIAAVDDDVLVAPCQQADPRFLRNGTWLTTGPQPQVPLPTQGYAWHGTWLAVDGAVIAWSTSTETDNGASSPYVHAEVWVPPAR